MKIRNLFVFTAVLLSMVAPVLAQDVAEEAPAEGAPVEEPAAEPTADAAPAEEATVDAGGEEKKISAALLLGFGLTLNDSKTGGENIYGLGFGVRGGYKVTPEIYVGLKFQYHLGYSVDVPGGEVTGNEMLIGLEGGYDLAIGDAMTLRPKLGLGLAVASGEATISIPPLPAMTVDNSSTDLYIEPGAALLYDVAQDIFIGGELGIPIAMHTSTILGLTIMVTGGMNF